MTETEYIQHGLSQIDRVALAAKQDPIVFIVRLRGDASAVLYGERANARRVLKQLRCPKAARKALLTQIADVPAPWLPLVINGAVHRVLMPERAENELLHRAAVANSACN